MGKVGLLGCVGALILVVLIFGGWYIGVRNHIVALDQPCRRSGRRSRTTISAAST